MKKLIVLILTFLINLFNSQSWIIDYQFEVKNQISNELFIFPAKLVTNNLGQKIYTVTFGIDNQNASGNPKDISVFSLNEKGSFDYILNLPNKNSKSFKIQDNINGKKYLFEDVFPIIKYQITNETKTINNVKLQKATTTFRGKDYIIWYDKNSPIKQGPWKFNNTPGLIYEIYDVDNYFKWTLKGLSKTNQPITTPFDKNDIFISFTEYPNIKYKTKVFVKNSNSAGGYVDYEQKRDGLEVKFEWEK